MQKIPLRSSRRCAYTDPMVMAAGSAGGTTIVMRSSASRAISSMESPAKNCVTAVYRKPVIREDFLIKCSAPAYFHIYLWYRNTRRISRNLSMFENLFVLAMGFRFLIQICLKLLTNDAGLYRIPYR